MGDKFGGHNKLDENEVTIRMELIKDVNLLEYGWVKKVSNILKLTHTQTRRFIKKYYKGEYYSRNSPKENDTID